MSRTALLVAFLALAAPAAAARVVVADPMLTPGVRSIHVTQGNPKATLVADLTCGGHIPPDSFDCIILTMGGMKMGARSENAGASKL